MNRISTLLAAVMLTGTMVPAQDPGVEEDFIDGEALEELRVQLEEFLQAQQDEDAVVEQPIQRNFGAIDFPFQQQRLPIQQPLDSASLKTDNESSAWLDRADRYAQQGRYDLASVLWQKVIDESSDLVFTREDWIEETLENRYQLYQGVASVIESSLAKLPEEGLDAYRLNADAEASLLTTELERKDRETALAEVVRRYFLSSRGDDAAFELACRKLERMEFLPAIRLFRRILDEYPAPSVPQEQVEIRLAAALAWAGETEQARFIVEDLRERPHLLLSRAALDHVAKAIEKADQEAGETSQSFTEGVAMKMGGPARKGVMPSLEGRDRVEGFSVAWEQPFELRLPDSWPSIPESSLKPFPEAVGIPNRRVLGANGIVQNDPNATPPLEGEALYLKNWRQYLWRPAGEMLVHNDRVYFKTDDRVVSCRADTGELEWLGFRNAFPMDQTSLSVASRFGRSNSINVGSPEESLLFHDHVHQSMTLYNDILYVLQGRPLDFSEAEEEQEQPQADPMHFQGQFMTEAHRTRDNRLVAYHAVTGKLLWYRKANEPNEDGNPAGNHFGFSGAPVPYGSLILVPVHQEATLWLYALDAKTGETHWRSFLCDEPPGQCSPHSPVVLAVDAGEAYVSSGAGYLFSLDAISGSLNWALNHPRTQLSPAQITDVERNFATYGMSRSHLLDGWAQDMLIPHGNALVVTTSDYREIFSVDRRTGKLLWESGKTPARGQPTSDYVLGVSKDLVFVAGNEVVRAYRLGGGKLIWETPVDVSFGRGLLTSESIFIPTEQSVLELAPDNGRIQGEYGVDTERDEPLGNLFTDGERLFAMGLRRIYALNPILQPKTSNQGVGTPP